MKLHICIQSFDSQHKSADSFESSRRNSSFTLRLTYHIHLTSSDIYNSAYQPHCNACKATATNILFILFYVCANVCLILKFCDSWKMVDSSCMGMQLHFVRYDLFTVRILLYFISIRHEKKAIGMNNNSVRWSNRDLNGWKQQMNLTCVRFKI